MRRRDFIKVIAGSATAWPLTARAQQGGLPTIGFLSGETTDFSPWRNAFVERLRELGWIDGRTIAIEFRFDEGRPEYETQVAAEFVRLKVDVIVTTAIAANAMKRATATIPIVFPLALDPVGGGLVASLAHPGGNVTGLSVEAVDLAGKRLELLREVVPLLRRLAIIADAAFPQGALEIREIQAAAGGLGLAVTPFEIRGAKDIAPAFAALRNEADALYVVGDALISANHTRVITLSVGARLPTIFNNRDYVKFGGLMSYGPNYPALFRRAADLVDRILRGTKPVDIPVEQPTKFELVVNLTTAQAIGLTIPEAFLSRADEVIE